VELFQRDLAAAILGQDEYSKEKKGERAAEQSPLPALSAEVEVFGKLAYEEYMSLMESGDMFIEAFHYGMLSIFLRGCVPSWAFLFVPPPALSFFCLTLHG
jgi:hypothetical protein